MNRKILLIALLLSMSTATFAKQFVASVGASTLYISSDYTFTGNIYEPIVVAADNIVIDGNGYTLQGPGYPPDGYGFYLDGRSGVTIKNVTINGWQTGIMMEVISGTPMAGNIISGNTISDNGDGIVLVGASGNTIVNNNIINNDGCGIWADSSGNTISGNTINANGYIGIRLVGDANTISGNTINANLHGILLAGHTGNTISGNTINANNDYGIWLPPGFILITGNNITNNGVGIAVLNPIVEVTGNIITGNNITNNHEWGMYLVHPTGDTISLNTIANNEGGIQILFEYTSGNTIYGNNITNNHSYGIQLYQGPSGNTIYHNNIIGNVVQAYDSLPGDNYWHNRDLLEGNYWSDYLGADDGSGTGKHAIAGDGIGDTNIPWPGPGFDYYPFVGESGWQRAYTLTITATSGGLTSPAPGTHTYSPGTVVSVTATSNTGYYFDHWELDAANVGATNPISVTMNQNHSLHAVFVVVTYDVTIKAHCYTEGVDVSVSITMDGSPTSYNTPHTFTGLTGSHTFTIPATDANGHEFAQWSSGSTSPTITVTSGGTYTAYLYTAYYGDVPEFPLGSAMYIAAIPLLFYIWWKRKERILQ